MSKDGGRIRFGWSLLEWPHVFIEAEHHAVYERPDGILLDITPPLAYDPQIARMFLPDDPAIFDFDRPDLRRDNIRQSLADDPLIEEYLHLGAESLQIMNRTRNSGHVSASDAERAALIDHRAPILKLEIALKYTAQGALCFCGSGQKFKRCHGQIMEG